MRIDRAKCKQRTTTPVSKLCADIVRLFRLDRYGWRAGPLRRFVRLPSITSLALQNGTFAHRNQVRHNYAWLDLRPADVNTIAWRW